MPAKRGEEHVSLIYIDDGLRHGRIAQLVRASS